MTPTIDIDITEDGWYTVTLYVSDTLELRGTGGNLAEALYELAEQTLMEGDYEFQRISTRGVTDGGLSR
jgi:hypothetical protein